MVPLVEDDAEAAVEGVLGQVGPGGLGVLGDDVAEQPLGFGVLLGGLVLGGERLLGVIDDEGDGQVGS